MKQWRLPAVLLALLGLPLGLLGEAQESPAPRQAEPGAAAGEPTLTVPGEDPAPPPAPVLDRIAGEVRIRPEQVFRRAKLLFGELEIDGEVTEDVQMVAGQITVRGQVHDRVELAFGEVTVTGHVGPGGVDVKFGEVTVAGTVEGPVTVEFGQVELIGDGAIGGEVRVAHGEQSRVEELRGLEDLSKLIRGTIHDWTRSVMAFLGLMALIGLALVILVLALLFRGSIQRGMALMDTENLAWDMLWGIAAVLASVPVFVALCVTIIGIPVAFLLMFLYPAAWLFGVILLANYLGDWILTRLIKGPSNFLVGTVFGIIVLGVSVAVPLFGPILMSLYTFLSIGVSFRLMFGYLQRARKPPAPPQQAAVEA